MKIHNKDIRIEQRKYSTKLLQDNQYNLFIFGDNNLKRGKGGQATIRDSFNAKGIPTKKAPSRNNSAYYTDDEYEDNISNINTSVEEILSYARYFKTIVFPKDGLGTGLADLGNRAPKTAEYLNKILFETFGYENPLKVNHD